MPLDRTVNLNYKITMDKNRMKRWTFWFVLCLAASIKVPAQGVETYYEKHLSFPLNADLQQKVEMAARLVPSSRQLAWQQMELTAFLHFGINTFTGREWGNGNENPELFNPSELDARQWVRTLKQGGFKMVILTAKHHDGFCLWPTKTTKHSVASSPWKGGKGDVVRELRDACSEYGMKFGVYLSPWDRNADCYGDSPAYNRFFIEQLTELLTNYGEVHEVWFDGANGEGPNGKKQVYDWDAFYETIQRLQPNAVMAIMGDDVRWVGNEKGIGRESEWSATVLTPGVYARSEEANAALGVTPTSADLGGREMLKNACELFWYPSEVDVSIRPGWFYHAEEDAKVKSLKHLSDIYFQSVGYNSVLLLNIPPDRRGLIHQADSVRLKEFADYRQRIFDDNRVVDGEKLWQAQPGGEQVYQLKPGSVINLVMLQEDITKGQRVEAFRVEAWMNGQWTQIAEGTTVGYKRIVRFPEVKTDRLRIKVLNSRLSANICKVAAFYAETLNDIAAEATWNNLPRASWKRVKAAPLVIDLGKKVKLTSFTYAPENEQAKPTMAFRYKFSVSADGKKWKKVIVDGEFSNIMHNPLPQTVPLSLKEEIRYIKLDGTTVNGKTAVVNLEEVGVTVAE